MHRTLTEKLIELNTDLSFNTSPNSFDALMFNITSGLTAQTATLMEEGESFYTITILPFLTGIVSGVGELLISVGFVSKTVSEILIGVPKTIEEKVAEQLEDLKEFLNEWKKDLII